MPLPTPIETTSSVIASASEQKVYTRKRWADEWEEQRALWCEGFDLCVSPSIPEARLLYLYGEGIEPGAEAGNSDEQTFKKIEPKDLLHHYVKIQVTPTAYGDPPTALDLDEPFYFYGTIEESTLEHAGSLPSDQEGDERVPTGQQYLRCLGLEFLLGRSQIKSSFVFDWETENESEVKRAVTFNAGLGQARDSERRGNRSPDKGELDAYIFVGEMSEGKEWTATNILEYLVAYHQPRDPDGKHPFNLVLDPDGCHENLAFDKPILETSGRTLRDLLNQIVDRGRLHCWTLVVEESPIKRVLVRVVPFTDTVINLLSGATIKPNPNQKELDFENAFDIVSAITTESVSQAYDQVVVRGANRGCIGTYSYALGNMEGAWREDVEESLRVGGTDDDDYAGLEPGEKTRRNSEVRAEARFSHVFSHLRVKLNWDGKSGGSPVCPQLDQYPDATIYLADPAPNWRAGLRFARYLPLDTSLDYSDDKIAERLTGDPPRPPAMSPDAIHPQIMVIAPVGGDRWAMLDQIGPCSDPPDDTTSQFGWHAHWAPLDNEMGVEIRVSGRYTQLVLADDLFTPEEDSDDEVRYDYEGQTISWKGVHVTAMFEADDPIESKYPEEIKLDDLRGGDTPRILLIDVRDRARLDYLAKGTWVGVKGGTPQSSNGGFIRDDRTLLDDLARLAGAWYLIARQSFSLQYRQIRPLMKPGDLITTIKQGGEDVEVNSLVTRISYDFGAQITSLQTDYAELDVRGLI